MNETFKRIISFGLIKKKKKKEKKPLYELFIYTRIKVHSYENDSNDEFYIKFKDWFLRQDSEHYVFKYTDGEDIIMRSKITNIIFRRYNE